MTKKIGGFDIEYREPRTLIPVSTQVPSIPLPRYHVGQIVNSDDGRGWSFIRSARDESPTTYWFSKNDGHYTYTMKHQALASAFEITAVDRLQSTILY
jgi:hypothetical protein